MGALTLGCRICKRRKVRCDGKKPKCDRCSRLGIDCPGFAPRLRFVDERGRIQRSMSSSRNQAREFATAEDKFMIARHPYQKQYSYAQAASPASVISDFLSLKPFEDNIMISYLCFKLVGHGDSNSSTTASISQCAIPKQWVSELTTIAGRPRHKSWDALAAVVFGRAHNDQKVVCRALTTYGQALSELRGRLSNPDEWAADSMLAAITALYMHEVRLDLIS